MGVGAGYSGGHRSCDCRTEYIERIVEKSINPDPKNFKIIKEEKINDLTIVEVVYPDCTNFEGKKLMAYRNDDWAIFKRYLFNKKEGLDPHFCNKEDTISPVARFIPTEEGWFLAKRLCENWGN